MLDVKRLVETLPDASLLREKTWRELQPLVKVAMAPYAKALQQAVYREETSLRRRCWPMQHAKRDMPGQW